MIIRFIAVLWATTLGNLTIAAESGPYLGAHIGYGKPDFKISFTDSVITANSSELSSGGIVGGGFLGYQFGFEKMAFAVEADYSGSGADTEIALGEGIVAAELNSLFSLTGKLAYSATDKAAVFIRAGYISGDFDASIEAPDTTENFSGDEDGWVVGVGLETELAENFSLYGEYQRQAFDDSSTVVDDGIVVRVKLNMNTFRAGIRYQF